MCADSRRPPHQRDAATPPARTDVLDVQHRELDRRAQRFLQALAERRGPELLECLLSFTVESLREHFAEELAAMRLAGDVEMGAHLAEHEAFLRDLEALAAELRATGPTAGLDRRFEALLVRRLREHVETADRALSASLRRGNGGRGLPS